MSDSVREEVTGYLETSGVPVVGAADARALDRTAPVGFRPSDLLPGARTVLVLAKPLPLAVFLTGPGFRNLFYVNAFSAYYGLMDTAAAHACLMLEQAGHLGLPVPSYSPIRFFDGQPRGVLSLKHAAVAAGLGVMGKNSLLIHKDYGNVLRLGGLVTTLDWPYAKPMDASRLCPANCRLCVDACPVGAIAGDGTIDKNKCMANCVRHVLLPPADLLARLKGLLARSPKLTTVMELFIYNFFGNYGIDCVACLKVCPGFPASPKPGPGK